MSNIGKIGFHSYSGILSCGPEPEKRNITESRNKGMWCQMEDANFLLEYMDADSARIIYNADINKTKLDLKKDDAIMASRVVQGDNIDRYQKLLHIAGFNEDNIEIGVSKPHSIARIDGLDALGTKEQVRVQRALIDLEMKKNKCPIIPSEYDKIIVSENGDEVLLESYSKKAFLDFQTNKKIMAETNQDGDFEITYYDEDGTMV